MEANDMPRNCDIGTAEEQCERMSRSCSERGGCGICRKNSGSANSFRRCVLEWAQMPYEEGVAK